MPSKNRYRAEAMMLLTGTIEHLQIGLGRANILSDLSGSKTQNILALADAIGGQIGGATMAASSTNHEIGELEYFACYIGEDLVQGVYPNVTFREGDEVEVVVQRAGSKNYVHAISKRIENLMWIPLLMEKSIGATFFRSIKHCVWLIFYSYVVWVLFAFLGVWDGIDREGQLFIWSLPLAVNLLMGIWDFAANYAIGMQSTKVFRLLGLPSPYWIDLTPYCLMNLDNDPYGECVYRYAIPSRQ